MNLQRLFFSLIAGLLLLAGISSCGTAERTDTNVSVSIPPVQYFVDRLTGNALEVNVMVPRGASHGTYSPSAAQMQKLSDSRLYIRIGELGYEKAFIRRLKELNPKMTVLNLSDHTKLIQGDPIDHGDHVHEGGIDPHIWMSPKVMLELLPLIKDQLSSLFPELKDVIAENFPALLQEIQQVHEQMAATTAELGQKRFLIFHPALTYLARDYGMEQVSIEHEGKEPTPARLGALIRDARAESIPIIFVQEEYDTRNAEIISAETGAAIVNLSHMSYNWVENMNELMGIFKQYLL